MDSTRFDNQPQTNDQTPKQPPKKQMASQNKQLPFYKSKKWLVGIILLLVAVCGVIAALHPGQDKKVPPSSWGTVIPDMDYKKPSGWSEKTVSNYNNMRKVNFTAPDNKGHITLIIQTAGNKIDYTADYMPVGQNKQIKLKSALFANQFLTKNEDKTYKTTTFSLRVNFYVFMNSKEYSVPANAAAYAELLDSFVPNGKTNQ